MRLALRNPKPPLSLGRVILSQGTSSTFPFLFMLPQMRLDKNRKLGAKPYSTPMTPNLQTYHRRSESFVDPKTLEA